jgi:hypothetical protein
VLPDGASFILEQSGILLRGKPDSAFTVLVLVIGCFGIAMLAPLALAAALGVILRGTIAFVLAALFATAAYCAPFFRDAARYLEVAATHERQSAATSLVAGLARSVLSSVPDLSPLAPAALLDDPAAGEWAWTLWPWIVLTFAAGALLSLALRSGPEQA